MQPAPRLDTGASAGGSTVSAWCCRGILLFSFFSLHPPQAHSKPADKKKKKGGLFKKGQASNAVEVRGCDGLSEAAKTNLL